MAYVYIIKSESGSFYTGSTVDLDVRIRRHNAGTGTETTKSGTWRLVYVEECKTIQDARIRERQIKNYKSGNAFKKLIQSNGEVAEWPSALPRQGGASC